MSSFKDQHGKDWTVTLDAPKIRAVRSACNGLDLASPDGKAFEQIGGDLCLMVDVLWVLCKDQAQKAGVSDVQFGEALVGDAFKRAEDALVEAGADFFPNQTRVMLRAVVSKSETIRSLGIQQAIAKINDPALQQRAIAALEKRMDAEIEKALTQLLPATSLLDSAESHLPDLRSGS